MQAEQVKQGFKNRGETIKSWCEKRHYDPTYVSRILNGSVKANRGKAHQIAVELGLKEQPDGSQ
ncbi:DNA-binding protein [Alysiella crassa]|uniref:Phage-associated protein, BcepMu gp16 family n=1 Tax=Alysiella crassa TaxID=153491 RepID=A0A376BT49_9NEIS|nr:DNA-binding protein [Alysiella crassa]UOP08037.1 DNA-binding protein [Alysiella crassa]SSY80110.1 phage-associated protein, BcepMu gp16 family [Alysiella crassa]